MREGVGPHLRFLGAASTAGWALLNLLRTRLVSTITPCKLWSPASRAQT